MTIATILPTGRTVFIDTNNDPIAGGKVYFYVPNTTTPKTTWQDAGGVTANANPVILDGNGSALIYGSGQYTQEVHDANNNLIYTALVQDNYGLVVNGNNTFTGINTFTGTCTFTLGFVLPPDTVTNAMLANMNANTIKVNNTASIAAPTDMALSNYNLLGRGATGNLAPITLGSGLTMSGTAMSVNLAQASNQQVFVSSGTWNAPAGFSSSSMVLVELWGAGGGGGTGSGGSSSGAGGGGGSYKYGWFLLSGLSSSVSVTIGGGGGSGQPAGNGGSSSFGTYFTAYGGTGGAGNPGAGGGSNGGAGGGYASTASAGSYQNDTGGEGWGGKAGTGDAGFGGYYTGGGGGADLNRNGGPSVYGGGGGASAQGSNSPGTSTFGGNGGSSSGNGHAPGGGGGGGDPGAGGSGAAGQCRVTVFA